MHMSNGISTPYGLFKAGPISRVFANGPVKSYQRLKKWYLMPPCLALGIISGKVEQSRENSSALPYTSM